MGGRAEQSFSFGRPPSLNASFIDCALPKDEDQFTNCRGEKELGCKLHLFLVSFDVDFRLLIWTLAFLSHAYLVTSPLLHLSSLLDMAIRALAA